MIFTVDFKKIRLAVYLPMEGRFLLVKKNAFKKLNADSTSTLDFLTFSLVYC